VVLSPFGRLEASRTRDLASPNSGNKAAERVGTGHWGLGSKPTLEAGADDMNAPSSHLPRMVESWSLEGESGVGVWSGWFCDRNYRNRVSVLMGGDTDLKALTSVRRSVPGRYKVACQCGFFDDEPNSKTIPCVSQTGYSELKLEVGFVYI
jgi:hypothetical protein